MNITEELKLKVWGKAQIPLQQYANTWRKDQCGAWIKFEAYGDRNNDYGWEIDHINPSSKGGSDNMSNLRPLQWENNASRQNDRLIPVITSEGNKNVHV